MSPIHAKPVLAATFDKALAARPQRLTLQSPVRYRTKGLGWEWQRLFLTTKSYPQEQQRFDNFPPLSPLLQSGLGGNNIVELVWDSEAAEQGT